MNAGKAKGLGDEWLDRDAAEQSMYGAAPPPPQGSAADQEHEEDLDARTDASEPASESASRFASRRGTRGPDRAAGVDASAPPPPARQRELRVQFNHRILSDRDRILQRYKNKHGATMQAIVDQMVDEYLERRGLLPDDAK